MLIKECYPPLDFFTSQKQNSREAGVQLLTAVLTVFGNLTIIRSRTCRHSNPNQGG